MNLELHLYPAERLALAEFLKRHLQYIYVTETRKLTIEVLVLQEYVQQRSAWNLESWHRKRHNKRFRFKIRLVVAKVLHQLMQRVPLSVAEQSFLNQLDIALVNLGNRPLSVYQVILSQLPAIVKSQLQDDISRQDPPVGLDQ
ncbi:hypothetical protein [Arsenicibacter rosenii]|uniref:Uncharacterized protein n=1 Tax=Arsenicibacter rosenii TaxID=1750698 RepID=A0A1S2VDL6_9BACT|nr:hypothetical protein [Arsenicibacter rosenii]OIN56803.1 hypothetical protein BLX24_22775 [Arsenicibacter rosenii]